MPVRPLQKHSLDLSQHKAYLPGSSPGSSGSCVILPNWKVDFSMAYAFKILFMAIRSSVLVGILLKLIGSASLGSFSISNRRGGSYLLVRDSLK